MSLASSGITVSAVKSALGSSNNNVGGLCSASNINYWSKWKPISLDAVTLTLDLLKGANYGISIKYASTASSLLNLVKSNGNLGFVYNKPTGISTSPYRLGDFRNYNHNAVIPLASHYKDDDEVKIGGVSSDYSIALQGIEQVVPDNLDSVDYLTRAHLYPSGVTNRGALITDGTNTYWSVGTIPWGNTYWQKFKGKTVTVLEFLTNLASGKNSQNHTSSSTDKFYALPEPLHTISVSSSSPSGSKTVFVTYNKLEFQDTTWAKVDYNFYFSAVGAVYAGGTLSNLRVGLATDMNGVNIIQQVKLTASSVTVDSEGVSPTYSGTLTNTGNAPNVFFCIWFNNALQFVMQPMQSPGGQINIIY